MRGESLNLLELVGQSLATMLSHRNHDYILFTVNSIESILLRAVLEAGKKTKHQLFLLNETAPKWDMDDVYLYIDLECMLLFKVVTSLPLTRKFAVFIIKIVYQIIKNMMKMHNFSF